jgi:predicted AAA+ superfamily ATPase
MTFERKQVSLLLQRLQEFPKFMVFVAGPYQVGKTTLVKQALKKYRGESHFISTDQALPEMADPFHSDFLNTSELTRELPPAPGGAEWLIQLWTNARAKARELPEGQHHVLAIDKIQKIPRWPEIVKGLWDADRAENLPLHIVLIISPDWLMQKGLTESLAGLFELIPITHWSYEEMQDAFDFSLDEYVYFGGYPGSAGMIQDEKRWQAYVRGVLIHPTIQEEILNIMRVNKPALLKMLFELVCSAYSGQIIAYDKLRGQLANAGNTTTLSHYLELLSQAGLLSGLSKFAPQAFRQRASSPKFNVHNTALVSAQAGYSFVEAKGDRSHWGRLIESAVGAHLINTASEGFPIFYWSESPHEVDFVLSRGRKILGIEVKNGAKYATPNRLEVFAKKFKDAKTLIVGEGGVSLADFLLQPADYWLD